eukprot:132057-Chlamydomonas_euryale.AAC.1
MPRELQNQGAGISRLFGATAFPESLSLGFPKPVLGFPGPPLGFPRLLLVVPRLSCLVWDPHVSSTSGPPARKRSLRCGIGPGHGCGTAR